jgi:hypothetical protein
MQLYQDDKLAGRAYCQSLAHGHLLKPILLLFGCTYSAVIFFVAASTITLLCSMHKMYSQSLIIWYFNKQSWARKSFKRRTEFFIKMVASRQSTTGSNIALRNDMSEQLQAAMGNAYCSINCAIIPKTVFYTRKSDNVKPSIYGVLIQAANKI